MGKEKYYWNNLASEFHQRRMFTLDSAENLVGDVRGVKDEKYMMYRHKVLAPPDGGRLYEFLIEYDIYNPSQGIYLGCKSVTLPGVSHAKQVDKSLAEWKILRPYIIRRLNNTFVNKDFTYRFRPADNDNDRTFWPFWIALYEEEDPRGFGCRVLEIIARVYEEYFSQNLPEAMFNDISRKEITVETAFTLEALVKLEERIKGIIKEKGANEEDAERGWNHFLSYLNGLESAGLLEKVSGYEYALALKEKSGNVDFKCCMTLLFEKLGERLRLKSLPTPWEALRRVFLRPDGLTYKAQIKTQTPSASTRRFWKECLEML